MSYVVVCNAENEDTFNNGGFSDPASFTNFYKSPLQIEPDSEVAVESVKIDRADKWSIKDTDTFFVYYGPEQVSGGTYEDSGDVPKNAVRIKIPSGAYNKDQIVAALKRAINKAPLGPLLFNNCNVSDLTDESSGKFKGFSFTFTSRGAGTNVVGEDAGDDVLAESMFVDANAAAVSYRLDPEQGGGNNTPAYSYDSGTLRVSCNVSQDNPKFLGGVNRFLAPAVKIHHPKGPVAPINGEFVFGIHGVSQGDWCIGLSRPTSVYSGNSGFPSIILTSPNGGGANAADASRLAYKDYWLQYKQDGAGSLRIFQWGGTTAANGRLNWNPKELKYFEAENIGGGHITGNVLTTADLVSNGVTGVKFLIDGNQVKTRLVCGGSVLTAVTITAGGTGYTNGEYTDVSTGSSGAGEGATLDITVAGGIITTVTVNNGGFGYQSGDTLEPDANIIGVGNNDLVLTVHTVSAAGPDIILTGTGSNLLKKYNFIPLHNATEALVPVIQMNAQDDYVTIDHLSIYTDTGMNTWKYPSSTDTNLDVFYRPVGGDIIPGSDWYSQNESITGDKLNFNARRPSIAWQIPGGAGGDGSLIYSNTGGGTFITDYVPVLVLGEEERDTSLSDYDQVLYYIPDPGEGNYANMGRNLGFGSFPVAVHSQFGGAEDTENITSINSIEAGIFTVHSAFIRINDLPIQSFNGATSSRSNILYHIPRFADDGRQFGELYFQAPEKTYLALNNTEKLMISQLAVDIVGRNEKLVNDLQGASIVCLHIRRRKK
jgi:hypothetical protein